MLLLPSFVLLVVAAATQGAPPMKIKQPEDTTSLTKTNTTSLTKTNRHDRIINGVDASDEYGYMVAVNADGTTLCGGTFVSHTWVLTAAQCVVGFTMWEVTKGVTDLTGGQPGRIIVVSATAVVHPDYSGNNYDIAAINTILVDTANIMPADLPSRTDTPLSHEGEIAIMTGWGATVEGGPTVTTLKQANGTFAGECDDGYHVCVYTYNEVDLTTGDYGGPLVVAGSAVGVWYLMGIAIATDLPGNRSVFTNVYQNLEWISNVTELPIYG